MRDIERASERARRERERERERERQSIPVIGIFHLSLGIINKLTNEFGVWSISNRCNFILTQTNEHIVNKL